MRLFGQNYGDELSAKGKILIPCRFIQFINANFSIALIYPTPLNIYGRDQLRALEKKLAGVAL